MNVDVESVNAREMLDDCIVPVPASVPGDFTVRLGEGWGGSLHELVDGLMSWELGAEAAAVGLLSWFEWVEVELQGFEDLVEQLRLLRGAVMTAAAVV